MIALLLGVALAGVPVVGEGPVDLAPVAARTGTPAEGLELRPLEPLLAMTPRTLGAATLRHCAGAPTRMTELKAAAIRGEAALQAGDPVGARDQLDLGISGLSCLSERVDAAVAGRLFLVRGALMASQGDTTGAAAELATALSFAPTSRYEGLPLAGAAVFEEVSAAASRAVLRVTPAGEGGGAWVDGQSTPSDGAFSLRPGLHLVQIPSTKGLRSAWLTLDEDAALVIPANFRKPVLERLSEPARRLEVERLLLATVGAGPIYVAAGGGLWLITQEGAVVTTTCLIEPPPPAKGR